MEYFEIGLYLAIVTAILLPIIILKSRFFKDGILEELYEWWDGREGYYDNVGVVLGVFMLLLVNIVLPLIIWFTWAALLPIGLLVIFISKARNRRIKKLNNK
jgi:hypothetical protein